MDTTTEDSLGALQVQDLRGKISPQDIEEVRNGYLDEENGFPKFTDIENCYVMSEFWKYPDLDAILDYIQANIGTDSLPIWKYNKHMEIVGVRPYEIAYVILCKFLLVVNPKMETDPRLKPALWVYIPREGIWKPQARQAIGALALALGKPFITPENINQVETFIEKMTLREVVFNPTPFLVGTKTGVLDLHEFPKKLKILDPSPAFFMTNTFPIEYDPSATPDASLAFLYDVLEKENVPVMQELLGDIIFREYRWQKFFIFWGGGSNGKGTFVNTLTAFVGENNYSTRSLQQIQSDPYAKADLFGKFLNICGDMPGGKLKHTNIIKNLSGGEPTDARRIYEPPFKFRNFAQIVASSNHAIEFNDKTFSLDRRLMVIKFPYEFLTPEEAAKKYPGGLPEHVKTTKDPDLISKLTSPQELAGLFNWGLGGLKRLLERNAYTETDAIRQMKRDYHRLNASAKAFVNECVSRADIKEEVTYDDLFDQYLNFCQYYELQAQDKKTLTEQMLSELGMTPKQLRRGELYTQKGKTQRARVRLWQGIKVTLPEELEEEEEDIEVTPPPNGLNPFLTQSPPDFKKVREELEAGLVPRLEGLETTPALLNFIFQNKEEATLRELAEGEKALSPKDVYAILKRGLEEGYATRTKEEQDPLEEKYKRV